jgi:hypothetical protein
MALSRQPDCQEWSQRGRFTQSPCSKRLSCTRSEHSACSGWPVTPTACHGPRDEFPVRIFPRRVTPGGDDRD